MHGNLRLKSCLLSFLPISQSLSRILRPLSDDVGLEQRLVHQNSVESEPRQIHRAEVAVDDHFGDGAAHGRGLLDAWNGGTKVEGS